MDGGKLDSRPHIPVLLREVLEGIAPRSGGVYADGTFGSGGHTCAMLEAADCKVYGIDRDPSAEGFAASLYSQFGERFTFLKGRYSEMNLLLNAAGVEQVDGILLDIGVSSMQLDQAERGFSFMQDGPLDMRMARDGQSAADLVNSASEVELANIIFKYGDERKSRNIAKTIVAARAEKSITRTGQLAEIIRKAVGGYNDTIHPATRSFQAIRIWVNNELEELEQGLKAAETLLKPGGRLAVITFHSGEDQIVKFFLNERSGKSDGISRHMPLPSAHVAKPTFKLVSRKAIAPTEQETRDNPRARSAKLRVAERI